MALNETLKAGDALLRKPKAKEEWMVWGHNKADLLRKERETTRLILSLAKSPRALKWIRRRSGPGLRSE